MIKDKKAASHTFKKGAGLEIQTFQILVYVLDKLHLNIWVRVLKNFSFFMTGEWVDDLEKPFDVKNSGIQLGFKLPDFFLNWGEIYIK